MASPAGTGRRLVVQREFLVASQDRRALEDRARELGFADLAAFLTDRYVDKEHSLCRIAGELDTTSDIVAGLRDGLGVRSHGGVRARGQSRQAGNDQRATVRAFELGFADLRGYLTDRYTDKAWPIPPVAAELGVGESIVTRLLRALGVRRVRATEAVAAAARRGRAREAALVAGRRRARLADLGFADLAGYLADRVVGKGWSLRRVRAELRVGIAWLGGEAERLGITRLAQP
jgi:hypothetical protein